MKNNYEKPNKIYFELTNNCNFNCDFCPITLSTRKKRFMDFSFFAKGIDEISRDKITDTIGFHVLGEPLLHPGIFQMLEYAHSRSLRTELTTNGALLTDECIQHLLDCKLGKLSISLETMVAEEHESRGARIKFDEYFQRVMQAVGTIHGAESDLTVELNLMNPISRKYFAIDRDLKIRGIEEAFRSKLLSLIHELCSVSSISHNDQSLNAQIRKLSLNRPRVIRLDRYITIYIQMLGDWGNALTNRKIFPAKFGFCGYAMKNIGILNNGDVNICCVDYDGKTSLGNLHNSDLASILASEKAMAIRDGLKKMQLVHPYCQRCVGGTNPLKSVLKSLISIYLFKCLHFKPDAEKEIFLVT